MVNGSTPAEAFRNDVTPKVCIYEYTYFPNSLCTNIYIYNMFLHINIYIYIHVNNIYIPGSSKCVKFVPFHPQKPTKRQPFYIFYISGRSRYEHLFLHAFCLTKIFPLMSVYFVMGKLQMSSVQNPGWLFDIGDEILPNYMGIWANYNDLSRSHLKWWFRKGIPPKSP